MRGMSFETKYKTVHAPYTLEDSPAEPGQLNIQNKTKILKLLNILIAFYRYKQMPRHKTAAGVENQLSPTSTYFIVEVNSQTQCATFRLT